MKYVKSFLLWIWQLPQNLLGLLLVAFLPSMVPIECCGTTLFMTHPSLLFFSDRMRGAVTLGRYVILNSGYLTKYRTWDHERGHSIQSMILGPLYLLVIGIPSLAWAALWKYGVIDDRKAAYYDFYTERWANRLGGVK